MQPTCCDAGADATGVTTDAADGSATDGADVRVISDADASLDLGPPRDDGGRSDIAEDGPLADVDRDAPPPIVDGTLPTDGPDGTLPTDGPDGTLPTDGPDGTPPTDGPDGTPPTDGPVDNPACPLRNPDPVVCADPDAGSPETRFVECTPLNPRTVATASYPASFKMDAQGIYWTAGFGEIYMLPNGASSPTMIVKARAVTSFHGFQLDDNAIYFDEETDGGQFTVTSIRRDGTARTTLATSPRGSLAIDGERLYIGDDGGRVAWIPKSGGMPVATPMPIPEGRLFLHDDTHFYWFEGPADDRTLKRWARNGVSSETVVDHQGSVFWMIQDATHLYWLTGPEYLATGIRRVAKNGTTAETLTSDLNSSVSAFIEQGDGLLLVARGGIVEVPKTGGCPRVLVTPPWSYRIGSPVADSASIYWQAGYGIETYISSLWRAPRRGGIAARLIAPGALAEPGGTYMTPTQIWWTTSTAISVMDRF